MTDRRTVLKTVGVGALLVAAGMGARAASAAPASRATSIAIAAANARLRPVIITPQLACVGPVGNVVPMGIGVTFSAGLPRWPQDKRTVEYVRGRGSVADAR